MKRKPAWTWRERVLLAQWWGKRRGFKGASGGWIYRVGPDGKPGTWDCGGLQMIRLILTDGKVLGPYVLLKGQDVSLDAKWVRIPLATSGPGDTP